MDDTVVNYIRGLNKPKRDKLVFFLKSKVDPNNDKLYLDLMDKKFNFEDLRVFQSEIFNILFEDSVVKKILTKIS